MYEESKSSIDWKGIILKVIVAFLIVIIAVKGYTTFRGNKNNTNTTTNTTAESKSSTTFTANMEKIKKAGEEYFKTNTDKLPKTEGTTTIVTLNELVNSKLIANLSDEDGKNCDGESSYVTATLEGKKTKIKANLVCGNASSYTLVYMSESDTNKESTSSSNSSSTTNNVTVNNSSNSTTKKTTTKKVETTVNNSCNTSSCPSVNVSTNTNVEQNVNINTNTNTNTNTTTTTKKVIANTYTVEFDTNGGRNSIADEKVIEGYKFGSKLNNYVGKKTNCDFKGWYLDGVKFDKNTPITEDITLVARYTCDNNYDYDNDNDYDYYYDEPQYYETIVYSIAWFEDDIDTVKVNHTLKVPEELEEDRRISEIKIADIEYVDAIDTKSKAENHMEYFNDTYMYKFNDWEAEKYNTKYLATIDSASFKYNTKYVDIDDAIDDGFEVTWKSSDISDYCSSTFKVTNGDSYAKGLCNYGISYRVIWQYR